MVSISAAEIVKSPLIRVIPAWSANFFNSARLSAVGLTVPRFTVIASSVVVVKSTVVLSSSLPSLSVIVPVTPASAAANKELIAVTWLLEDTVYVLSTIGSFVVWDKARPKFVVLLVLLPESIKLYRSSVIDPWTVILAFPVRSVSVLSCCTFGLSVTVKEISSVVSILVRSAPARCNIWPSKVATTLPVKPPG